MFCVSPIRSLTNHMWYCSSACKGNTKVCDHHILPYGLNYSPGWKTFGLDSLTRVQTLFLIIVVILLFTIFCLIGHIGP